MNEAPILSQSYLHKAAFLCSCDVVRTAPSEPYMWLNNREVITTCGRKLYLAFMLLVITATCSYSFLVLVSMC